MKNSSRLSLHLQIRSFKNTFFQFDSLPFKGLLPHNLIEAIEQSGDIRSTVFTPFDVSTLLWTQNYAAFNGIS